MRIAFAFRYPKTAVLAAAACFYVPFVADWCEPGPALHQAAVALGALPGVSHPWFWNKIVCLVGRDVPLLGTVSMVSAFVCALMIAFLAGSLIDSALHTMRRRVSLSDGQAAELRGCAEFLTALAFVLTPGFFHAATRIGPLHSLLIPFLAGLVFLVLLVRVLTTGKDSSDKRLKHGIGPLFLSLAFLFYAACEMALSRPFLQLEKPTFIVFSLIGLLPLAVLSHLVRRRLLLTRRAFNRFFFLWALLIAGFGFLSLQTAGRGHVASRVVRHIVDNAWNCRAIVSDGAFDLMFYFMLPDDQRLILLSRDNDRDYGRDLADWILKGCGERTDLSFAAELGPRALVDEWTRQGDRTQMGAILTPTRYFPTLEKWREACSEIAGMDGREPYGTHLRALLGASGNRFGCRCLEAGETATAWAVFWEILNRVDAGNYPAFVNVSRMLERGYVASQEELDRLVPLREANEQSRKKGGRLLMAARADGQVIADAADVSGRTNDLAAVRAREELPVRVREFIDLVSVAPQTEDEATRLREMIRKGLASGRVKPVHVGTQLLTLDLWLKEWENAEKDAFEILRHDSGHVKANAVMGTAAASRSDYRAAEYYFRRVLAVGGDGKDIAAKDLAFALACQNRADEAEPFARQVVASRPDDWNCRETLAFVLIRQGKADEGERELRQAIQQAERAGVKAWKVSRFSLDCAWLYKVRGEKEKMASRLRVLSERGELTRAQWQELKEIER